MTATVVHCNATGAAWLNVAFELGWAKWKLAFGASPHRRARLREIEGGDLEALQRELARAKARLGLPADAPVRSCYEAGRDGFWLHRWLTAQGIDNLVIDAGSMKVNGRRKRAKTDRLDAQLLLGHLMDHHAGHRDRWSVVRVPSLAEEERRQLHREMETLQEERTAHINRIKGLLASVGVRLPKVTSRFPEWLALQRCPGGQAVPAEMTARLLREFERWRLADEQCEGLEKEQRDRIIKAPTSDAVVGKVRRLLRFKGIGAKTAWLLTMELFGWRTFANRRELGSLTGLTPTPYNSGETNRDQGISKVGNRRVRGLAVEIAWGWLRYQPDSALSRWYWERFGKGSARQRKIGIVALARKLVIALWQALERGKEIAGAEEVDWRRKLRVAASSMAGAA
jgi:transposase